MVGIDELRVRREVPSEGAIFDLSRLGQPDTVDGNTVVRAAVDHEGIGVIGNAVANGSTKANVRYEEFCQLARAKRQLEIPINLIETDTFVTRDGHQNPASYGTFPRALSTYVKEGLFSLEEAVRKMTGGAAERLGWKERGWVRPGCAADLVVLDTATLQDTATFEDPARFPLGIERVFINGRAVVEDGRYDAGAGAGRVLRG